MQLWNIVLWLRGVTVTAIVINRSQLQLLAAARSGIVPGQAIHAHVPLPPSSVIWYRYRLGRQPYSIGLASHWPGGTDTVAFSPVCTGSRLYN